jgi:hypothetical protein
VLPKTAKLNKLSFIPVYCALSSIYHIYHHHLHSKVPGVTRIIPQPMIQIMIKGAGFNLHMGTTCRLRRINHQMRIVQTENRCNVSKSAKRINHKLRKQKNVPKRKRQTRDRNAYFQYSP